MATLIQGLIEYAGIADTLPILTIPAAFKQFTLQENLCIPEAKPDIEQLTRVLAEVKIISTKVIQTPTGTSPEGQNLTGWKLIVEGEVCQKIEYVADEPTQSVHAAHFCIPFSTFIVLPGTYVAGTPVTVVPYIEDIYAQQIGKRSIFKNIVLFLHAQL